jgi:hypothetical protein
MADTSHLLLVDALQRAAAEPEGMPLFRSKQADGLFATSASAKKTARLCKDEGLVHTIRSEAKGRTTQEICALTEKGLAFLLNEADPKQVLESLVRGLEARHAQIGELVESARRTQGGLEALKSTVEKVLQQLQQRPAPTLLADNLTKSNGNGVDATANAVLEILAQWQAAGALEDCPLPQLYRRVSESVPRLTIGQFHDTLRRLQERTQIYLHPWTGPLYELLEPALALMVGHEIAYYASLRD